jgi:putative sigma-54 modulation protein
LGHSTKDDAAGFSGPKGVAHMQVSVTFRHMEPTQALKDFAAEKVGRIRKYIHSPTDAHVVLSTERYMHKADITIKAHGMMMRGEEKSDDMYSSIDGAVDKIERQVKRYRKKLTSHKPREGARMKVKYNILEAQRDMAAQLAAEDQAAAEAAAEAASAEEVEEVVEAPKIIETTESNAVPMSVDEAVMQMDLAHSDFHVFINAKTNEINVLYRRRDGQLGLIEAHGTAPAPH